MACCGVRTHLSPNIRTDDSSNMTRENCVSSCQSVSNQEQAAHSRACDGSRDDRLNNINGSAFLKDFGDGFKEPWSKLLSQARGRYDHSCGKAMDNVNLSKCVSTKSQMFTEETDTLSNANVCLENESIVTSDKCGQTNFSASIEQRKRETRKSREMKRLPEKTSKMCQIKSPHSQREQKRASSVEWDWSGNESPEPPKVPQDKSRKTSKKKKRTPSISSVCSVINSDSDDESSDNESISSKGSKKHVCHICDITYRRPWLLRAHLYKHISPESRPFACNHEGCSKAYFIKQHLDRHKSRSHSDLVVIDNIQCSAEGCTRIFKSGSGLKRHINKVHSEESLKFSCSQCDKKFSKSKQLRYHIAEHDGQPPIRCLICNAGAYSDNEMKRHMRSHKRHLCDVPGCDQSFTNYGAFRKHKAAHDRCFHSLQCAHCNKKFTSKCNLRDHVNTHLDDRPVFRCPYESCPRVYYQQRNLNSHIRVKHEKISNFACNRAGCDMLFQSKRALTKHLDVHENGRAPMVRKEGPRARRKDAGKPKRAMAGLLTGITIPNDIEKKLLSSGRSLKMENPEPEAERRSSAPTKCVPIAIETSAVLKKQSSISVLTDGGTAVGCLRVESKSTCREDKTKNEVQKTNHNICEGSISIQAPLLLDDCGSHIALNEKTYEVGEVGALIQVIESTEVNFSDPTDGSDEPRDLLVNFSPQDLQGSGAPENSYISAALGPVIDNDSVTSEPKVENDQVKATLGNKRSSKDEKTAVVCWKELEEHRGNVVEEINSCESPGSQGIVPTLEEVQEQEKLPTPMVPHDGQLSEVLCKEENLCTKISYFQAPHASLISNGASSDFSVTLCAEAIVESESFCSERELLLVIPKAGKTASIYEVLGDINSEAVIKALTGDVEVYSVAEKVDSVAVPERANVDQTTFNSVKKISVDDPSFSSILLPLMDNLATKPGNCRKELYQDIRTKYTGKAKEGSAMPTSLCVGDSILNSANSETNILPTKPNNCRKELNQDIRTKDTGKAKEGSATPTIPCVGDSISNSANSETNILPTKPNNCRKELDQEIRTKYTGKGKEGSAMPTSLCVGDSISNSANSETMLPTNPNNCRKELNQDIRTKDTGKSKECSATPTSPCVGDSILNTANSGTNILPTKPKNRRKIFYQDIDTKQSEKTEKVNDDPSSQSKRIQNPACIGGIKVKREFQIKECSVTLVRCDSSLVSKDNDMKVKKSNKVQRKFKNPAYLRSQQCKKNSKRNICKGFEQIPANGRESSSIRTVTSKVQNPINMQSLISKLAQLIHVPARASSKMPVKLRNSTSSLKENLKGPTQDHPVSDNSSDSDESLSDASGSDENDYNEEFDEHEEDDNASDGDGGDRDGDDEEEEEEGDDQPDEDDDNDDDEEDNGNNHHLDGGNDDNNNNNNDDDNNNRGNSAGNNLDVEIAPEFRNGQHTLDNGSDFGVDRSSSPRKEVFDDSDAGRSVHSDDLVIVIESESDTEACATVQTEENQKTVIENSPTRSISVKTNPTLCSPSPVKSDIITRRHSTRLNNMKTSHAEQQQKMLNAIGAMKKAGRKREELVSQSNSRQRMQEEDSDDECNGLTPSSKKRRKDYTVYSKKRKNCIISDSSDSEAEIPKKRKPNIVKHLNTPTNSKKKQDLRREKKTENGKTDNVTKFQKSENEIILTDSSDSNNSSPIGSRIRKKLTNHVSDSEDSKEGIPKKMKEEKCDHSNPDAAYKRRKSLHNFSDSESDDFQPRKFNFDQIDLHDPSSKPHKKMASGDFVAKDEVIDTDSSMSSQELKRPIHISVPKAELQWLESIKTSPVSPSEDPLCVVKVLSVRKALKIPGKASSQLSESAWINVLRQVSKSMKLPPSASED